jgi:hypothetical protein
LDPLWLFGIFQCVKQPLRGSFTLDAWATLGHVGSQGYHPFLFWFFCFWGLVGVLSGSHIHTHFFFPWFLRLTLSLLYWSDLFPFSWKRRLLGQWLLGSSISTPKVPRFHLVLNYFPGNFHLFPTSPALLDQVLYLERLATLYGVYSRRHVRRRRNGGLCSFVGGSSWLLGPLYLFLIAPSLVSLNPLFGSSPFYVLHVMTLPLSPLCTVPGAGVVRLILFMAFGGVV